MEREWLHEESRGKEEEKKLPRQLLALRALRVGNGGWAAVAKFKGRRRRRRRTVGGDARGKGRKKVFFLGRDFEDKTRIQAQGKAGDHSSKKLPKKPQKL